jgi:hypothetical protein
MKADQTPLVAKLTKVPPVTAPIVPSEEGGARASSGMSPPAEFFKLHDRRSIKKLHVNLRGEENSPRSYLQFMLALLNLNPVITQAELETELLEHFKPSFGPEDVRMMKVGKRGMQPKWKIGIVQGRGEVCRVYFFWWLRLRQIFLDLVWRNSFR